MKRLQHHRRFQLPRLLAICVLCLTHLLLSSCTNRHNPAPVLSLSTKVASAQNLTEITTDYYTVESGDTLFAIAFYSGNDYRDLARINNLRPPYTINIGQVLRLNLQQAKQETVQNSSKKAIDRKQEQEYRDNKLGNRQQKNKTKVEDSVRSAQALTWIWPAAGRRTIATVGSDGSKRGLDIKGKLGSKIVAAASGKIVYAGNALKGYGNLVIIKHNDDYLSAYAHNKSILVDEKTYVKQGQQIATMGNSGSSDTMLHFEIRKRGQSVDPFKYLPKL